MSSILFLLLFQAFFIPLFSATWTQRQAWVSHPAIGIKNRPKWSVFFPLWPCEDIQILQIYPFHFYFFDFQNFPISNVLFIVGCRGKRTVCILIGAHHDIKHSNQQKGTPIQSSFSVVRSSFGLVGIKLRNTAMLNFSPLPEKGRKGKYFCHLYEVKGEPANRLF